MASLPPARRVAALQGRLPADMSPDAVEIARGRPGSVTGGPAETAEIAEIAEIKIRRHTILLSVMPSYYDRPNYL